MALYTIENETARVTVSEHASEIHSFFDKTSKIEYMWQGDPNYWAGRNPTLFPMVGSTWNKEVVIDGQIYHMGNHGFCRNSDFTCIKHSEDEIVMQLKDSEETLAQYPFHFELTVSYVLKGKSLQISYLINNNNERVMPFNFGLHPAFNCPLTNEYSFADYKIETNQPECFQLMGKTVYEGNEYKLEHSVLEKTLIITSPSSNEFRLKDGSHSLLVKAEGYPWVAFWSGKNNAPFVCIEPWHSHADFSEVRVPFEEREGTLKLQPHQQFQTEYSITIE